MTTYIPPYDTCTAMPFDVASTGPITGNDLQLSAALRSAGGGFTLTFGGARNGNMMTGSAVVNETLHDGGNNPYPTSGNTGMFAANKQ